MTVKIQTQFLQLKDLSPTANKVHKNYYFELHNPPTSVINMTVNIQTQFLQLKDLSPTANKAQAVTNILI
jgi:hypothetical protein